MEHKKITKKLFNKSKVYYACVIKNYRIKIKNLLHAIITKQNNMKFSPKQPFTFVQLLNNKYFLFYVFVNVLLKNPKKKTF